MSANAPGSRDVIPTVTDLRRAAAEGVITSGNAAALLAWASGAHAPDDAAARPDLERGKGLNWASVAYYSGAMLMIGACAWFLGDKWKALGSSGILATTIVYAAVAGTLGIRLRRKGFLTAGGLLVTVAVSLVPLISGRRGASLRPVRFSHRADGLRAVVLVHGRHGLARGRVLELVEW